jgi:hypothetical protein
MLKLKINNEFIIKTSILYNNYQQKIAASKLKEFFYLNNDKCLLDEELRLRISRIYLGILIFRKLHYLIWGYRVRVLNPGFKTGFLISNPGYKPYK